MKKDFNCLFIISLMFALISFCSCTNDSRVYFEEPNGEFDEAIGDNEINNRDLRLEDLVIEVPTGGNSWVVGKNDLSRYVITDNGIVNWNSGASVIRTFVHLDGTGQLSLGIKAKSVEGSSVIKITVGTESKEITIRNSALELIPVGIFNVEESGYVQIDMQGVSKTDDFYGEVSHLVIGGEATSLGYDFVKDDFYWGRRGPSVHLAYQVPENVGNIEWFYNELTVPQGQDVIGSYFMTNGFAEGYFGIQVNSRYERRVLFSVWSPFQTDDPSNIPEEDKIKLLKKGDGVTTGEFGNEGSGGQSFKRYNWQAGNTYKFLLKVKPSINESTDYTAYFYTPEHNEWELIASFRRPKTSTYLKRPHSFLENFNPEMGSEGRKAYYSNQWLVNTEGQWIELNEAQFTADATARKRARLDYAGGVENGKFYLKNGGFFNERVAFDTYHQRAKTGIAPNQKRTKTRVAPVVEFNSLP